MFAKEGEVEIKDTLVFFMEGLPPITDNTARHTNVDDAGRILFVVSAT